jgi:hypothetical protein
MYKFLDRVALVSFGIVLGFFIDWAVFGRQSYFGSLFNFINQSLKGF